MSTVGQNAEPLFPRLNLRVGITGHRPARLGIEGLAERRGSCARVLDCVAGAAGGVAESHGWAFAAGEPVRLRLVTALAEGADTVAAELALDAGFALDVIIPFAREEYARDFAGAAGERFEALWRDPRVASRLELTGVADPSDPDARAAGYLAAGRAMLTHVDLLVAMWDELPEAGRGGTAQIVREALDRGLPVVNLLADGGLALHLPDATAAGWQRFAVDDPAWPAALAACVGVMLAPPAAPEAEARLRAFFAEPERTGSRAVVYQNLRRRLTGKPLQWRLDYGLDAESRASWARVAETAERLGGAEFAASVERAIARRWRHADNAAVHYAHVYRSAYVANFALAALAVLTGLLAVFWWTEPAALHVKALFVTLELVVIGVILAVTWRGQQQRWHGRWLDYRSLAEALRPARLGALIGEAPAPFTPALQAGEAAWWGWYLRASLREVGPPSGRLGPEALGAAIDVALREEIGGQIAYHRETARQLVKLDHVLHHWGERCFLATAVVGGLFLVAYLPYLLAGLEAAAKFLKAPVTVLGAALPAFGASIFGIRAIGDFRTAARQSEQTAATLAAVHRALEQEREAPSWARTANLFAEASRSMAADQQVWALVYRHRELALPA